MFKNYFKVAFRNLLRHKSFSVINIAGLAIGMASAVLILLWVENEVSYDRFHANINRLYQVWGNDVIDGKLESGWATPQVMGPAIKKDYPEAEDVARFGGTGTVLVSYKNKAIKINGTWADASLLTMFSFPLISGDAKTALDGPNSIVITQDAAKKIFGNEDPMGKVIRWDNSQNFTVTGVLKNLPNNTAFDFEFLNSSKYLDARGFIDQDWTDVSIKTFVLLKPKATLAGMNAAIKDIAIRYSGGKSKTTAFLYPVSQLRLYSEFENGKPVGGLITTVRIFAIVAGLILLIACINFMNLSTAKSYKRAKEVGIRKVMGALKLSLVSQFLIESILLACIAGLIALIIVQLSLPAFNRLTDKQLFIDYGNIYFWLSAIGFILITGLLAGSYPAFFISAFKPVAVLKGLFKKVNALVTPRKALVMVQFTFAIILIVCTIVVERQMQYAQQRKTGYNKNDLVYVPIEGDIPQNYQLIKNELLNTGTATAVNQTLSPLTQLWSFGSDLKWHGQDTSTKIGFIRSSSDGDLVKVAGLQLTQGRDIDVKNYLSDSTACLLNKAAVKAMGLKNVIGLNIYDEPTTWHVVGVLKDFVVTSPYQPISPMIFKGPKDGRFVMNIRFNSSHSITQSVAAAEKILKKYNPAYPLEYHFIDEEYAKKFENEKQAGTLAGLFACLTIFISCLGLFGLATYMAETRVKEIGVRKILGASVFTLWRLLSNEFLVLIMLSVLIASPVALWVMHNWLQNYPYHINMSLWIFVLTAALVLLIALLTVSFQAIKAALANPVKSLRTE